MGKLGNKASSLHKRDQGEHVWLGGMDMNPASQAAMRAAASSVVNRLRNGAEGPKALMQEARILRYLVNEMQRIAPLPLRTAYESLQKKLLLRLPLWQAVAGHRSRSMGCTDGSGWIQRNATCMSRLVAPGRRVLTFSIPRESGSGVGRKTILPLSSFTTPRPCSMLSGCSPRAVRRSAR